MKYLVMEVHPGWAVVLDEDGRFCRVANMHYTVGETVEDVVFYAEPKARGRILKFISAAAAAVACLCLIVFGWQFFSAYGTVRIQINPDVRFSVNRFDRVLSAEGLNADGEALLENCSVRGRRVQDAANLLSDRAVDMGFLKDGMEIHLKVDSTHEAWRTKLEEDLTVRIRVHFTEEVQEQKTVYVIVDEDLLEDILEAYTEPVQTDEPKESGERPEKTPDTPKTDNEDDDEEDDEDDGEDEPETSSVKPKSTPEPEDDPEEDDSEEDDSEEDDPEEDDPEEDDSEEDDPEEDDSEEDDSEEDDPEEDDPEEDDPKEDDPEEDNPEEDDPEGDKDPDDDD